jgi:hypothetical protein
MLQWAAPVYNTVRVRYNKVVSKLKRSSKAICTRVYCMGEYSEHNHVIRSLPVTRCHNIDNCKCHDILYRLQKEYAWYDYLLKG